MIDLIWEIFQTTRVEGVASKQKVVDVKLDHQNVKQDSIDSRLREIERRHEQLKLITLSLWSLLRDHSGLLESDLRKYISDIDLLDGKKDGIVSHKKEKSNCTNCERFIFSTASVCPYCGQYNEIKDPFKRA